MYVFGNIYVTEHIYVIKHIPVIEHIDVTEHVYAHIDILNHKRTCHCESRHFREPVNRGLSEHHCRNFTRGTEWACTC